MSWNYKLRKMRDAIRNEFTQETGLPHTDVTFKDWLVQKGYLSDAK